jgi:hypothetical protein
MKAEKGLLWGIRRPLAPQSHLGEKEMIASGKTLRSAVELVVGEGGRKRDKTPGEKARKV